MKHPLRALVSLAALLAAPGAAFAGLGIQAPARYVPGEVLTITVAGDSEGAERGLMSAILTIEEALTLVSVDRGTLHSSDPFFEEWIHTPASGTCGGSDLAPNQCLAVDAFAYYTFEQIDLLPSTLTTWQFDTSDATGNLLFLLQPHSEVHPGHVDFFGLPGTQATVVMIPEPATAALVTAGLLVLSASRRRAGRRQTIVPGSRPCGSARRRSGRRPPPPHRAAPARGDARGGCRRAAGPPRRPRGPAQHHAVSALDARQLVLRAAFEGREIGQLARAGHAVRVHPARQSFAADRGLRLHGNAGRLGRGYST